MGTQRRSWSNPAGRWISLGCLGVAIIFGALTALSAAEVFDWGTVRDKPLSHWWGTCAFGVLFLVPGWFAFLPTWSITVGTRGTGIRKLWRHVFIPHDEFESAALDKTADPPRIRIMTSRGSLRVFPNIADAEDLARHLAAMKKQQA